MTISKSDILAFVNKAVHGNYTGTDLDIEIQMALDDLAGMHCLKDEDTTQKTSGSGYYLNYPSDCLSTEQAIISVTLADASGPWPALTQLTGGWQEYLRAMGFYTDSGRSTPRTMVCNNGKIYLYPAPSGEYDASIFYYKRAQAVALGIEFPDDWKLAVFYGSLYFTHFLAESSEGMQRSGTMYFAEKERCRIGIPRDLGMVGG